MSSDELLKSFIEMCVFYDSLIKWIHQLQNLVNERQKEKLDMLTEIDIVLKKISSYYSMSEKWQKQAATYKRETAVKQNLIERYKQQQSYLIDKIVKLHNMNWSLADAVQHITGRKIVKQKPKNPQPFDPNRVLSIRTLPSMNKIEDDNSLEIHNLAETNLVGATASVYNFFLKKAQPTFLDIQSHNEQKVVQQLMEQLSKSTYSEYRLVQNCNTLIHCLKTVSDAQKQYAEFLKSLRDIPNNPDKIDWSRFSADMNILAEAYDRRVKIDHNRYRYWNEACCILQQLRWTILQGQLRQKVQGILLKSELFCKLIKDSVEVTVAFQDCILRYRMLSQHMKRGEGLTDTEKQQKFIPKLRENVLHEKELMNHLAKTIEEKRRTFGTNRSIFEESLKDINGKFNEMITTIREKEARIEHLEKDAEERNRRSMMMDLSLVEADTSMAARRSRRKKKNLVYVSKIIDERLGHTSAFSFNGNAKQSQTEQSEKQGVGDFKTQIHRTRSISNLVADLNHTIRRIQSDDQRVNSLVNQIDAIRSEQPNQTAKPIIVNNEEITNIKELVFQPFKVHKKIEEPRRYEPQPFPQDMSPVPQGVIQKSFEQYVDENVSGGFFNKSQLYDVQKQPKIFTKQQLNKFQRDQYNRMAKLRQDLNRLTLMISEKQLETQQLKQQNERITKQLIELKQKNRGHFIDLTKLKEVQAKQLQDYAKQREEQVQQIQELTLKLEQALTRNKQLQKITKADVIKEPEVPIINILPIPQQNKTAKPDLTECAIQTDNLTGSHSSLVFSYSEDPSKTIRRQSSFPSIPNSQDPHHSSIEKGILLAGPDFDSSVDKHHLINAMSQLLPSHHNGIVEDFNEDIRSKNQYESGFTIEQLHELRKNKITEVYEIQRKMIALSEQKILKQHEAHSEGDNVAMLGKTTLQLGILRQLKFPNIDQFITMRNDDSKIHDLQERDRQKDQFILKQSEQINRYRQQVKQFQMNAQEHMRELIHLKDNEEKIDLLKITIIQLQEQLNNVKNSQSNDQEIRTIRHRLEDLQELEPANRALKIEIHDYQHRMMQYSTKLANLEMKLKQVTEQLEQLQRKNKQRIIKQQQWLRQILENPGFLPINPEVNKQFLKMVYMMQQKLVSQEKQIRDMMEEFEIDKKQQAESIMLMKNKLLESLPNLPID